MTQNGADDHYHALSFQVTHPWVNGLYFTMAYTYARSQTEATPSPFETDQTSYTPEYVFNRARDIGANDEFTRHDFVLMHVWDVPWGRGKRLGQKWNKVVDALAGNWTFNGSFSWRSGIPFTPTLSGKDPGNIGSFTLRRPSLVPGCDPMAN
jgi:hypothetical protein